MPDPAAAATLTPLGRLVAWLRGSYLAAVVRRFFDLELLDRAFGLAAQAFVALLPLVIVTVSVFVSDSGTVIADQISDRFGLGDTPRAAIRALFASDVEVKVVSWLAVVMSLLSAWALSRRLARVYAAIFAVPPLRRSQTWHGLVWIGLQVGLFIVASLLRDVRQSSGIVVAVVAAVALLGLWFLADVAGLRLLVPAAPRRLVIASAITSSIGRAGLAAWSAVYMPATLSEQAQQYGPIGVTFAMFTYILAGVLVYVGAPLLVTTWADWRRDRSAAASR